MRHTFQEKITLVWKRLPFLIVLLVMVAFLSACPEGGGEGGEGASEGAGEAPGAVEPSGESVSEVGDSASDSGSEAAIRFAEESSSGESTHFLLYLNEDGVVESLNEMGMRSEIVARFSREGQLWEVNNAGAPIRPIARLNNGELLWEVNRGGTPIRSIARVRATIRGTTLIEFYAKPNTNFGRIGTIDPGNVIEIISSQENWLYVRQNGQEGWIRSSVPFFHPIENNRERVSRSGNKVSIFYLSLDSCTACGAYGDRIVSLFEQNGINAFNGDAECFGSCFADRQYADAKRIVRRTSQGSEVVVMVGPFETFDSALDVMIRMKSILRPIFDNEWQQGWPDSSLHHDVGNAWRIEPLNIWIIKLAN